MGKDWIHLMRALFLPAAGAVRDPVWRPAADVYRTPHGWLVKFDLAGVRPGDVALETAGPRLTLRGTRRDCFHEAGCRHYRLEIAYSQFERTVELPCDLRRAALRTEHRDGMLLVHIDTEIQR